jgi:FkbM family methyltransferase
MLPFRYWLQRFGGECEPELLHLGKICGSLGSAVDIGTNWGGYTYSLSKRFPRVYAFEINEEVTGWIRQYDGGNIELVHCGLSSVAGTAKFYVPVAHGFSLTGWGSLNRDNLPGADKYIENDLRVAPLDDFGITGIGFMKIDVEGHEVEVLKGAAATVRQSRPIILIEIKTEHLEIVDSWFLDLNYRHCRLEDFARVRGDQANHIYVPVERLTELGVDS